MSKEAYMYYSDCRQASFTYKKAKRFREWCNLNSYVYVFLMSRFLEYKVKDEIMDILGFLAYEIVSVLTEQGLKVKMEWERDDPGEQKEGVVSEGLFAPPPKQKTPLQPRHIREGFRRSQDGGGEMQNYQANFVKRPLVYI
jgi:transcription initiation protein SPT3